MMSGRKAAAVLVLAAAVAGCGGAASGTRDGGGGDALRVDTSGWKTDFGKHSVPLGEFQSGGPGRDGIPPIDDPKTVSQDEADQFLGDREPILVVELGRAVRAYPIQILVWHEIVNDRLAGRQIAVTYCPLCNSSLVFDRHVAGRTLTFGTTGNLRNSDLVMWDRQTESWWQQITADAVVGKLTGTRLKALPSETLSWAAFKRRYPQGDVLSRDTGFERPYGSTPYEAYDQPNDQPFLFSGKPDDRLPPKERVAAVFAGGKVAVFPFSRLEKTPVRDAEVGGTPVVVFYEKGVVSPLDAPSIQGSRDIGTAAAFGRRIGGRTLDFEQRGRRFVDRQTGSEWDITGRAVSGALEGERLPRVRHDEQFWFALAAFVPDARIER
jgi:Protein of unknown function (DUF3179)